MIIVLRTACGCERRVVVEEDAPYWYKTVLFYPTKLFISDPDLEVCVKTREFEYRGHLSHLYERIYEEVECG